MDIYFICKGTLVLKLLRRLEKRKRVILHEHQRTLTDFHRTGKISIIMAGKEKLKLPPLLAMSLTSKSCPARSEYGHSFTPKVKLVQPSIKLAPSFMYRRPPDFVRGHPRESFHPGFVPAARSGGKTDYVFSHNNSFYSNTQYKRTYFTVRPDWVSEKSVSKNNPLS